MHLPRPDTRHIIPYQLILLLLGVIISATVYDMEAAEPLPASFITATPPPCLNPPDPMPKGMTYATPPSETEDPNIVTPDSNGITAVMDNSEYEITIPENIKLAEWRKTHDWWYLLRHGNLNLSDTTVIYPKFLGFCVNVYNKVNNFINSYDSDYVRGTGKRWKARLMSDNWNDGYYLTLKDEFRMRMLSEMYCNAGVYLQYSSISIGYSVDLSNIIGNKAPTHKKVGLGISCARFDINLHYDENTGGTFIRHFSKFENNRLVREKFDGLKMHILGGEAYYFMNHRRYSEGAAYKYSRIQVRSQGSAILGVAYNYTQINIDLDKLPASMYSYLTPDENRKYRFHYNSYCVMGGYGYNLVCGKHLLFNITALPKVGFAHMYEHSTHSRPTHFACGILAKSSMTVNLNNYFLCLMGQTNGTLLSSDSNLFYSSIYNVNLSLGIRF